MLAYVFWHWRRPDVPAAAYEALQRRFHAALEVAPPAGFIGSRSVAIAGAPWAAGGGEAYEDWYLVDGWAGLDPLNAAAVSASRQGPHDGRLPRPTAGRRVSTCCAWARRATRAPPPGLPPAEMSHAALFAALGPLVHTEGRRLGPVDDPGAHAGVLHTRRPCAAGAVRPAHPDLPAHLAPAMPNADPILLEPDATVEQPARARSALRPLARLAPGGPDVGPAS
jgi:hypothetical protein